MVILITFWNQIYVQVLGRETEVTVEGWIIGHCWWARVGSSFIYFSFRVEFKVLRSQWSYTSSQTSPGEFDILAVYCGAIKSMLYGARRFGFKSQVFCQSPV